MKFTESSDGIERTSIRITLRFTREELAEIKRLAKRDASRSWRDWVEGHAALGVEGELTDEGGEMEQRYGRGGD